MRERKMVAACMGWMRSDLDEFLALSESEQLRFLDLIGDDRLLVKVLLRGYMRQKPEAISLDVWARMLECARPEEYRAADQDAELIERLARPALYRDDA